MKLETSTLTNILNQVDYDYQRPQKRYEKTPEPTGAVQDTTSRPILYKVKPFEVKKLLVTKKYSLQCSTPRSSMKLMGRQNTSNTLTTPRSSRGFNMPQRQNSSIGGFKMKEGFSSHFSKLLQNKKDFNHR